MSSSRLTTFDPVLGDYGESIGLLHRVPLLHCRIAPAVDRLPTRRRAQATRCSPRVARGRAVARRLRSAAGRFARKQRRSLFGAL